MTTKERLVEIVESLSEDEATEALQQLEELRRRQEDAEEAARQERVRKVKAARGVLAGLPGSVEEFLRDKRGETLPLSVTATPEEWAAFVHGFPVDLGPDVPILTDEQLRREHLYEDRGA